MRVIDPEVKRGLKKTLHRGQKKKARTSLKKSPVSVNSVGTDEPKKEKGAHG